MYILKSKYILASLEYFQDQDLQRNKNRDKAFINIEKLIANIIEHENN